MRNCGCWPGNWFARSPAKAHPALEPQNLSTTGMSNYSTVDRESFQELLASAFAVQQMDSQSRSVFVKVGRLVTRGDLDVEWAVHLIGDRTRNLATTLPPRDEPSTAADSEDAWIATFRDRRDQWTTLLLILVIALALLLGWLLGRVKWRGTAHTKGPPATVSVKPDTASTQSDETRQADPSPPPPIPPKARSREASSDSLVVYQDGKVIFRLKPSQEVGPSSPKSGETMPDPAR